MSVSNGLAYGGVDLQGSVNHHPPHYVKLQHAHHLHPLQGLMPSLSMDEVFPLTIGQNHELEQPNSADAKNSPSDDEDSSFNEEGMDGHSDQKGIRLPWQRVKWTDSMIRLLITAASYVGEDALLESGPGGRRIISALHKKGKWKSISKVMAERGFCVSPQQCEDKFNDLNKRYKKLNDILGRGTSCQVVENPSLLDMMNHLSEKTKNEVRKILSSKHLFYEEMCSYHNNNRLHLPHDPALQRSLQLALRCKDAHDIDSRRHTHDNDDDHDHDMETDDHDDYEENCSRRAYGTSGDPSKRMKQGQGCGDFNFGIPQFSRDFSKGFQLQSPDPHADMNLAIPEDQKTSWLWKHWLKSKKLQLEEQKVRIEIDMLELDKKRFKWQCFSRKKDRELEKLKMENEKQRLENERIALELKRMEMNLKCNQ